MFIISEAFNKIENIGCIHWAKDGGVLTVSTEVLTPETNWSSYQGKDSTTPLPEKIMRVKFSDTGSGLGLSVSYAIIEKYGGSLEVEIELDA